MALFMYVNSRAQAFPTIVDLLASNTSTLATSHVFNYPGGTTVAGELLLAILVHGNTGTWTTPSGYTSLIDSGAQPHGTVFYKVATGSEGATLTATTSNAGPAAAAIYRISGYLGTPEATKATGNGTGAAIAPDPPSLTPSWGAQKTLWIAAAGVSVPTTNLVFSSYPSGFGSGINSTGVNIFAAQVAAASLNDQVSPKDPGAFAMTTTAPAFQWAAFTIAIQPI